MDHFCGNWKSETTKPTNNHTITRQHTAAQINIIQQGSY